MRGASHDREGRRVGVPEIGDGNMPSLPALHRVIQLVAVRKDLRQRSVLKNQRKDAKEPGRKE